MAALVASSGEEKQTKSNLGVGDCAVGSPGICSASLASTAQTSSSAAADVRPVPCFLDVQLVHCFLGRLANLGKHFLEFLVSKVFSKVLDVHVVELLVQVFDEDGGGQLGLAGLKL